MAGGGEWGHSMARRVIALSAALLLAGEAVAAPAWTPQVDPQGLNQLQYQQDLAQCTDYANANPDADGKAKAQKSAKKWGLGTIAGMGALTVLTGGLAAVPVLAGTVVATGGGAALGAGISAKSDADAKYRSIVLNCLSGRGYRMLG